MDSKKFRRPAGLETTEPAIRVSRLTESNLTIADPGENVLNKQVISREGKECGIVADLVIAVEPQQVLFIEVLLTGQRSPKPVSVLVPVEAVRQITGERVYLEQPADRVRHAPQCNLSESYELWREQLYGHFGYPCFQPQAYANGNGEGYGEMPYWSGSARFSPHLCPPDQHRL
jgi:sporulation protein YlmC with PRC-barrel domain